jgi:hypothetical protein
MEYDGKFHALLSAVLIPQIVDLIVNKENVDDVTAVSTFYRSETYALLEREETKVWHYSPLTIYNIWKTEKETGQIELPEEGLLV